MSEHEGCDCTGKFAPIDDMNPLNEILEKYAGEKGALIPMLQAAQSAYGYIDKEIMKGLAKGAGYQLSQLYGVATFYTQFRLKPIGKHLIRVCHGTACHVAGAELLTSEISNNLGIEDGETTEDRRFTLETVVCVGACSLAPIVMVDEDTHGRLKPTSIKKILKKYSKDSASSSEE